MRPSVLQTCDYWPEIFIEVNVKRLYKVEKSYNHLITTIYVLKYATLCILEKK